MPNNFRNCYAHFIRPTLKVAANYGLDTKEALRQGQLDPSISNTPYQIINNVQLCQFFAQLLANQVPAEFGLEIGREIGLADKGALGHAQLSARNLRHIMALGQQFMPMFMPLLNWSMSVKKTTVSINYRASLPAEYKEQQDLFSLEILEHFLVDIILGMHIHQAQRAFSNLSPDSLQIPKNRAKSSAHYKSIFQGNVSFETTDYSLQYPMQSFDAQLLNYDQHMCDVLETECTKLLQNLERQHDIVSDVTQQLSARLGHFPGIEQLANKLDISARTLRRRLQEKGSSYQSLLNDAKHRRAIELLNSGNFELHIIAQLCGFSELRNFSNSFKRWQGCSVHDYQNTLEHKL